MTDPQSEITALRAIVAELEEAKKRTITHYVNLLSSTCTQTPACARDLSLEAFIAAGGGACSVCLTRRVAELEAELAKSRAEETERAREDLAEYMGALSEEYYCACWLIDWEYYLWGFLVTGRMDEHYYAAKIKPEEAQRLRELHELAGGWCVNNREEMFKRDFVSLDKWRAMYARWKESDAKQA